MVSSASFLGFLSPADMTRVMQHPAQRVSIHGFRVTRPGEAAAGARPVSPDSATALANPAKSRCGVDASC